MKFDLEVLLPRSMEMNTRTHQLTFEFLIKPTQGRTEANLRFGPRTKKAPLYIEQFPWELNFLIVVKCFLQLFVAVFIELTDLSCYSFHYKRRLKLCKILNNYKKIQNFAPSSMMRFRPRPVWPRPLYVPAANIFR